MSREALRQPPASPDSLALTHMGRVEYAYPDLATGHRLLEVTAGGVLIRLYIEIVEPWVAAGPVRMSLGPSDYIDAFQVADLTLGGPGHIWSRDAWTVLDREHPLIVTVDGAPTSGAAWIWGIGGGCGYPTAVPDRLGTWQFRRSDGYED